MMCWSVPMVHYSGHEAEVVDADDGGFLIRFRDPKRKDIVVKTWSDVISSVMGARV